MLPGALLPNRSLRFTCRDIHLRVENSQTIFTCGYEAGQTIRVPVAHHDGNYTADPATLDRLDGEGLVAFRYCGAAGELTMTGNFNGSARAIAGIFNETRTVLGLMPHPENATDPLLGGTDGQAFFAGLVERAAVTGMAPSVRHSGARTQSERPEPMNTDRCELTMMVAHICRTAFGGSGPRPSGDSGMTMENGSNVTAGAGGRAWASAPRSSSAPCAILGRTPNLTELGIFSAMWSEHCSYKSSKIWLKTLPTTGPRVICGPGRECRGRRYRRRRRGRLQDREPQPPLVYRALSGRGDRGRRHPARRLHDGRAADGDPRIRCASAAPTIRRPGISSAGVVAGIGGYGNCVGVPTVGGECQFHPAYNGNILVNAMCVGLARADRIFYSAAAGPGKPRRSMSAPRPGATASTARRWPRPSSAATPARSGRPCRSATRSPRNC